MLRFSTTLKSHEITSIAIGGFDGMHKAHVELFKRLDDKGVLLVIDKGFSNLTPDDTRVEFFKNGCIFLNLCDIKEFSDKEFVKFLKMNFPALKRVVVGYDFGFGKNRAGDLNLFKKEFELVVVSEVKIDELSVHSQTIRELLTSGDIKKANKLLGREYEITSFTKKGQGIGAEKLVATINLDKTYFLLPKSGVYATKTKVGKDWINSITFIGVRASTDGEYAVETHLLDKNIDFLPKKVEIKFFDFVRDNKKFDTMESLKNQIQKDIDKAKATLETK